MSKTIKVHHIKYKIKNTEYVAIISTDLIYCDQVQKKDISSQFVLLLKRTNVL